MASEPKKNDFGSQKLSRLVLKHKEIPRSILYKNRWCVRIFKAWQAERENKLVMSEDNPFALDLTQVK